MPTPSLGLYVFFAINKLLIIDYIYIYIYIYIYTMVRVFANGLGDLGSVSGRVVSKTQKWYMITPLLNT